jgi:hypothetical protein
VYSADCADLAQYCSAFARIYAATVNTGAQPDFDTIASMTDVGYQNDGAPALKHYHAAARGVYSCGTGDPDSAYSACKDKCDEDPDGQTIGDKLTTDCLKARGPELK